MNTPFNLNTGVKERIVYVRSVDVADLPDDVRNNADGMQTIYALHTADGERLALVANRDMAFALARQNDFAPVTVH